MAKFVIAGSSDCPHFSKVELLADELAANLPNFNVHKIVKQPFEWQEWIDHVCSENGWLFKRSPIVWRELVDRGGKGVLIGGANEFQEYAKAYYGMESELISQKMRSVADDNVRLKQAVDAENRYLRSLSSPIKICITNACSMTAYHIIPELASGNVITHNTEISLILHDTSDKLEHLKGLQMEAFDLGCPLLRSISITDNFEAAVSGCSVLILMDQLVRRPASGEGEEAVEEEAREDWLRKNYDIYTTYGEVIDRECTPDVKVVVVGTTIESPVNFNVAMIQRILTRVHPYNVVGLSRPVERQLKAVLAKKMNVNSARVVNAIFWGNLFGKKFLDLTHCRVFNYDGSIVGPDNFSLATEETIWDKKWLKTEMGTLAAARTKQILAQRPPEASGLATAHAVTSLLHHWWNGSRSDEIYSLAVASQGWYDVPEGMVFSFPVTFHPRGYYSVVQDVEVSDEMRQSLKECIDDLVSEKEVIFPPPSEEVPVEEEEVEETEVCSYRIHVHTGKKKLSGTDSNVFINLFGEKGDTGDRFLTDSATNVNKFEIGNVDEFTIEAVKLGKITKIRIGHDGAGSGWFLDKVSVMEGEDNTNKEVFECNRWFDTQEDDGLIVRELKGSTMLDEITYEVSTKTGDVLGAGTDANVFIHIFGASGDLGIIQLETADPASNKFEKGRTDTFKITAVDIGEITNIRISHDGAGAGSGWYLDEVAILVPHLGKRYVFPAERWLDEGEGDAKLEVDLVPSEIQEIDKSVPTTYHVNVFTGDEMGAGTDANVHVILFGEIKDSGEIPLKRSKTNMNKFERGNMDEFDVEAVEIGEVKKIRIGHDNLGGDDDWYLDRVEIDCPKLGRKWYFPCGEWIGENKGVGITMDLSPDEEATEEYPPSEEEEVSDNDEAASDMASSKKEADDDLDKEEEDEDES